jgi:hypothetical protein
MKETHKNQAHRGDIYKYINYRENSTKPLLEVSFVSAGNTNTKTTRTRGYNLMVSHKNIRPSPL